MSEIRDRLLAAMVDQNTPRRVLHDTIVHIDALEARIAELEALPIIIDTPNEVCDGVVVTTVAKAAATMVTDQQRTGKGR